MNFLKKVNTVYDIYPEKSIYKVLKVYDLFLIRFPERGVKNRNTASARH